MHAYRILYSNSTQILYLILPSHMNKIISQIILSFIDIMILITFLLYAHIMCK